MKTRKGPFRVCFMPEMSQKAAKRIRIAINEWPWQKWQQCNINVIIRFCSNKLRGWMNYYPIKILWTSPLLQDMLLIKDNIANLYTALS